MMDSNKKFGEREREKIFELWRKYEAEKHVRQEWDTADAVNNIYARFMRRLDIAKAGHGAA